MTPERLAEIKARAGKCDYDELQIRQDIDDLLAEVERLQARVARADQLAEAVEVFVYHEGKGVWPGIADALAAYLRGKK